MIFTCIGAWSLDTSRSPVSFSPSLIHNQNELDTAKSSRPSSVTRTWQRIARTIEICGSYLVLDDANRHARAKANHKADTWNDEKKIMKSRHVLGCYEGVVMINEGWPGVDWIVVEVRRKVPENRTQASEYLEEVLKTRLIEWSDDEGDDENNDSFGRSVNGTDKSGDEDDEEVEDSIEDVERRQ